MANLTSRAVLPVLDRSSVHDVSAGETASGTDVVGGRALPRLRPLRAALRRAAVGTGRRVTGAADRLLHPVRRRLLERRLASSGLQDPVVVVCYGNICRSPYAAAALRKRVPALLGIRFESGGFIGADRPSPPEAMAAAAARDIALSDHRSRPLNAEQVRAAGLVIVMDAAQARWLRERFGRADAVVLGDLDPQRIRGRTIEDPVAQPEHVFTAVYERIDRCVDRLLAVTFASED